MMLWGCVSNCWIWIKIENTYKWIGILKSKISTKYHHHRLWWWHGILTVRNIIVIHLTMSMCFAQTMDIMQIFHSICFRFFLIFWKRWTKNCIWIMKQTFLAKKKSSFSGLTHFERFILFCSNWLNWNWWRGRERERMCCHLRSFA